MHRGALRPDSSSGAILTAQVNIRSVLIAAALAIAAAGPARADRATARALVEEGQRLVAAGAGEAALGRFERAMAEDADYLPAYDAAIPLWLAAGQMQPLIDRLAQVTLRHPRYAAGWYALAAAYRRTERHALAVLCYQTYLELRPGEPDPYFGVAMSHIALGDRTRAVRALERYLALERRAERSEFTDRARLELARLRGDEAGAVPLELAARVGQRLVELARAVRALF